MGFIKRKITDKDVSIFQKKGFKYIPFSGENIWSIDEEQGNFLTKMGDDRYDMGGTTNQFWWFFYQNQLYYISCKFHRGNYVKIHENHFVKDIVKLETVDNDITNKKNISLQELMANSDEFIKELENAFNIYKGSKYIFNFKFAL